MLLLSKHRTFDPEEADYFYVPLYVTCYFWPVMGWADHPWWHAPIGIRPMHGANMMNELKQWLQKTFPFWDRHGGRDHIWLTAADEGACWMPKEIYDMSIILTHWGRLDPNHTSNTAYAADNYNRGVTDPIHQPIDWTESIKGHACYDPKKDLVIPSLKPPSHFNRSPLLGNAPFHRDILLFFKAGDGWSARLEDSILHGCIPLIIQDGVHTVFESILNYDAFSVRIEETSMDDIPTILKAIPMDQIKRMQKELTHVWHRFAYASGALIRREMNETFLRNMNEVPATVPEGKVPREYPIQRVEEYPFEDDAFSTIMQWLYAKIPETRGP
ncbi:hypothetical protein FOA52_012614 [Chlamydomonas sp. UWO 241]|nr:hypothetical protein FOA52_012614 [Chlamydomonas sp. UWO 241]